MLEDTEKLFSSTFPGERLEEEYRAFWEGCAVVGRHDRAAVRVSGDRAAEMLNGLLSNRVVGLEDAGCHGLLLNARGRVLTDLRVLPRRGELLLDVPRTGLENLMTTLRKYLPPMYASFEDVTQELVQFGVYGPLAEDLVTSLAATDVPAVHLGVRALEWMDAPALLVRNHRLAGGGFEVLIDRAAGRRGAEVLAREASSRRGRVAGRDALEIVRVESGVPAYGRDMSEDNIAQETGLEAEAISYDKGCFLGQEVVARVHFRGRVNRHLRGLKFGGGLPPAAATLHADDGKEIGRVTSAVESPELGPIGLGYVRREFEPPATVRWTSDGREGAAAIVATPFRGVAI